MTNRKHFSSIKKLLLCIITGTIFNTAQSMKLTAIQPRQGGMNSSERVVVRPAASRPTAEADTASEPIHNRPSIQPTGLPSANELSHPTRINLKKKELTTDRRPENARPIAEAPHISRPSPAPSKSRPSIQPVALPSANEPSHPARPTHRSMDNDDDTRRPENARPVAEAPHISRPSPAPSMSRPTIQPIALPSANEPYHSARPTYRTIDNDDDSRRPRPNYPRPNYSRPNFPRPTTSQTATSNESSSESSETTNVITSPNQPMPRPTLSYHRPFAFLNRPSWFPSSANSNQTNNTSSSTSSTEPESKHIWAVWNHANGDNNLADFIDFNANSMAKANINDSLLVLIQADRPYDYGTYRYQIKKGKIDLVDHLSYEMGQQPGKEIVDGISWLQKNYSFTHLILNLWGHGSGPKDIELRRLRGILFDDTNNTYLNNQDLSIAVDRIASKLGKNIDILGTDACLMGAIEIGWQVKNSVDILVASEDNEPGEGWSYEPFLNTMATEQNITAKDSASAIVQAYDNYYKKGNRLYTLSAVELKRLPAIATGLHDVIKKIKICLKKDARSTLVAIMSARALTIQMDDNSYVDLIDFLNHFSDQLSRVKVRSFSEDSGAEVIIHNTLNNELNVMIDDSRNLISDVVAYFTDPTKTKAFKSDIENLKQSIESTINIVKKAVIKNVSGNGMERATGMTIYFPPVHSLIHQSYPLTKFAKETDWMNEFLINIMGYEVA